MERALNPPDRPGPHPPPGASPEDLNLWMWMQQTHSKAYEAWEGIRELRERMLEYTTRNDAYWNEGWRWKKEVTDRLDCLQEQIEERERTMREEVKELIGKIDDLKTSQAADRTASALHRQKLAIALFIAGVVLIPVVDRVLAKVLP